MSLMLRPFVFDELVLLSLGIAGVLYGAYAYRRAPRGSPAQIRRRVFHLLGSSLFLFGVTLVFHWNQEITLEMFDVIAPPDVRGTLQLSEASSVIGSALGFAQLAIAGTLVLRTPRVVFNPQCLRGS